MPDRLKSLPPETLASLADYYGAMAEDCASVERIKSRRAERRAYHERRAAILQSAALVRARLSTMEIDAAVRSVADETEIPLETVLANYRIDLNMRAVAARARRDRRIVTLAMRGWTNGEIAAEVGLCSGTVSRIIQRGLRDGLPPRSTSPWNRECSR